MSTKRISTTYDRLRNGDVIVTPERHVVWVDRPEPVLPMEPLPTEEHTVIRVRWKNGATNELTLNAADEWENYGSRIAGVDLQHLITGWEPLAEPLHSDGTVAVIDRAVAQARSETDTGLSHEAFAESYPNEVQWHYDGGFKDGVKTLLARIATEPWAREIDLTKWREEFGVDHG